MTSKQGAGARRTAARIARSTSRSRAITSSAAAFTRTRSVTRQRRARRVTPLAPRRRHAAPCASARPCGAMGICGRHCTPGRSPPSPGRLISHQPERHYLAPANRSAGLQDFFGAGRRHRATAPPSASGPSGRRPGRRGPRRPSPGPACVATARASRRASMEAEPDAPRALDALGSGQDREEGSGAGAAVGGQCDRRAQVPPPRDPEQEGCAAAWEALRVQDSEPPPGRRGVVRFEVVVELVALLEVLEPVVPPVEAQPATV